MQAVSMGDGGGSGLGGSGRQAYVTLLYGEAFMLGVRVLGQSLRETGTTRYPFAAFWVSRHCFKDVVA
jgi:hypothetical protein